MQQLTFQNWDEYEVQDNDGFLNSDNYKTVESETNKRKQLQSQHSQTRDYLNTTVKNAVETLQSHEIVSGDSLITVNTFNNVTTIGLLETPSGVRKTYVDEQDLSYATSTLNNAKAYTDEGLPFTTVAPVADNVNGKKKLVILTSEPATKYNGYIYLIKES